MYGLGWTRNTIMPYLEYVPDPDTTILAPCDKPTSIKAAEVQIYLSCVAKNNSIFVVANMGARQPCPPHDSDCPVDGVYQYSTNVVYNPKGQFVARYFKYNLDKEETYFDKPRVVNLTTFETPFGRFGTFTSSDILYKDPTVTLIKKMNVTNIAYPSAWREELPLMSAIEFHSAFSEGISVNLLAANLHIPTLGYYGSGLYWPTGTSIDGSYYYNDSSSSKGYLVVDSLTPFLPPENGVNVFRDNIPIIPTPSRSKKSHKKTHKLKINGDEYTSTILKRSHDFYNPHVCQGEVCCDASIEGFFPKDEVFAFGAFDGVHVGVGEEYYLQACVFIKCANSTEESCGSPTKMSQTDLDKMSFVANFSLGIVFPEVLSSYGTSLGLVTKIWYYQGSIIIDAGIYGAPISIAMLNRDYSRDRNIRRPSTGRTIY